MEKEVIFGHSPDSDDAFMYYGIASGNVKLDNFKISHHPSNISLASKFSCKSFHLSYPFVGTLNG